MVNYSCEKCGKTFSQKGHYTKHLNKKNPCVVESKIKEMLDKVVEEKLNNRKNNEKITIDTSTFNEIKKYYDETLNTDKSTYKSSNDEPTPIDCISEMISKIPNELWGKSDLSILDPCCGNGNFSIPIIFELLKYHDKKKI